MFTKCVNKNETDPIPEEKQGMWFFQWQKYKFERFWRKQMIDPLESRFRAGFGEVLREPCSILAKVTFFLQNLGKNLEITKLLKKTRTRPILFEVEKPTPVIWKFSGDKWLSKQKCEKNETFNSRTLILSQSLSGKAYLIK